MERQPSSGLGRRPRQVVEDLDEPAPAIRRQPGRVGGIGPASRQGPLGRAVEGDAEHVAVARHEESQPFEGPGERSLGGPSAVVGSDA